MTAVTVPARAQAVVASGPGRLSVRELAVPTTPPEGGALMQVLANGICGSDWDLFAGHLDRPGGRPAPFPMVPGHEPVGRILAIDEEAARRWGVGPGDRVAVESRVPCRTCRSCVAGHTELCRTSVTYSLISVDDGPGLWGGMAEVMVLRPGSFVEPVPESVSDADATLFNPLGNALYWTVEAGGLTLGDRVLVLGAGQRGLCCAVAAAEAGAAQVIVTGLSRDAHKLALAASFGATHTSNVETEPTVEMVERVTCGAGVDLVVDTVPTAVGPMRDAIEALRPGGTLVSAGVKGPLVDGLPLERFRSKQLRMVGVSGTTSRAVREALRILGEGRYPFHRLHTHVFGLDRAADAIQLLGGAHDEEKPIHVLVVPARQVNNSQE